MLTRNIPITNYQRRLAAPTPELRLLLREIPPKVFKHWQLHAREEFVDIPTSPMFFLKSACALFVYFKCVEIAGKQPTLLPSKAADSVWHAWLECDPKSLSKFCIKHFRTDIKHVPVDKWMLGHADQIAESERKRFKSIQRTYIVACILDDQDFISGYIPSLFRHDREVRMPWGHSYERVSIYQKDGIYVSTLGRNGCIPIWKKPEFHEEFTVASFIKNGYLVGAPPQNRFETFASPRTKPIEHSSILAFQASYYEGYAGKHCRYDYEHNRWGEANVNMLGVAYVVWTSQACEHSAGLLGPEPPPYVPLAPSASKETTSNEDTTTPAGGTTSGPACGGAACGGGGCGGGCGGCG